MSKIPQTIHIFSIIPRLSQIISSKLPEVTVKNVIEADIATKYEKKITEKELAEIKDAEIILGDSHFISQVYTDLPHAKWVQCTWAGVEKLAEIIRNGSKPNFPITRLGTQTFSQLMAEYTIGWIINYERGWLDARQYQLQNKWFHDGKIAIYRSFRELKVAVLGVGAIGSEVASALKYFNCTVYGFGRRLEAPNSVPLDKYFSWSSKSGLESLLDDCDYIVNILPSTPETEGLLGNEILKFANKKPVFINIGRGSIINEEEIIKALDNNWISAAILDVFEVEPLAKSSPLWEHPKVIVTPHVAGVSRPKDVVGVFMENWSLFIEGKPLKNVIDWDKGY